MPVHSLEHSVVGQGVVDGPHPCGDPVAQQHVYAVVAMAKKKSRDAGEEKKEGEPVEQVETSRAVCKFIKIKIFVSIIL